METTVSNHWWVQLIFSRIAFLIEHSFNYFAINFPLHLTLEFPFIEHPYLGDLSAVCTLRSRVHRDLTPVTEAVAAIESLSVSTSAVLTVHCVKLLIVSEGSGWRIHTRWVSCENEPRNQVWIMNFEKCQVLWHPKFYSLSFYECVVSVIESWLCTTDDAIVSLDLLHSALTSRSFHDSRLWGQKSPSGWAVSQTMCALGRDEVLKGERVTRDLHVLMTWMTVNSRRAGVARW